MHAIGSIRREPATGIDLPVDPFDGKPLRYKIINPGYTLYSLGPILKDLSGLEDPDDPTKGNVAFDVVR